MDGSEVWKARGQAVVALEPKPEPRYTIRENVARADKENADTIVFFSGKPVNRDAGTGHGIR